MILLRYPYPILHKIEWLKTNVEFGIVLMGFSAESAPLAHLLVSWLLVLAEREGAGTYSAGRQKGRTASTRLSNPVVRVFKNTEPKAHNWERMSGERGRTESAQNLDLLTSLRNCTLNLTVGLYCSKDEKREEAVSAWFSLNPWVLSVTNFSTPSFSKGGS